MKQLTFLITVCLFSVVSQLQAQEVTITNSNWSTYMTKTSMNSQTVWQFNDIAALRNAKKITIKSYPSSVGDYGKLYNRQGSKALANLEELTVYLVDNAGRGCITALYMSGGTKLKKLVLWIVNGNYDVSTSNFHLCSENGFLTPENIIFKGDAGGTTYEFINGEWVLVPDLQISDLHLKRNKITDLTYLYPYLAFTRNLQLNGGKYHRKTYAGVDDGTYNPTNLIREIDMTKVPRGYLRKLLLRHNLLEKITDITHSTICGVELQNNLMWSLDLSSLTAPIEDPWNLGPQKPVADLTVVKGDAVDGSEDEVRLYLPEGQSELFNKSRLVNGSVKLNGNAVTNQKIFGTTEKYFKVASVAEGVQADLDLYGKHNGFSYQYNTNPNLTDASQRDMDVEVKTYPYIMYVHPATLSGAGVNYYSGTLWLDYDAIVPEGTTVWIVTGINKEEVIGGGTTQIGDQLVMEMIGGEGDLIPAGTAMYVRSDTKAGLYAFHKAWTHDMKGWDGPNETSQPSDTLWYDKVLTNEQIEELAAQRALIGNRNLLEGHGTETVFDNPREALILGIESQKGTGMIGFWPYNGTVIPAHRCFISEATYRRVTGDANAKGATFLFDDAGTTGITDLRKERYDTKDDIWYTLDGRRLNGKPMQKGVYLRNNRKEVIR